MRNWKNYTKRQYSAIYTGKGEFYSGIEPDSKVLVEVNIYKPTGHMSIAISKFYEPGPWLAQFNFDNLILIDSL